MMLEYDIVKYEVIGNFVVLLLQQPWLGGDHVVHIYKDVPLLALRRRTKFETRIGVHADGPFIICSGCRFGWEAAIDICRKENESYSVGS